MTNIDCALFSATYITYYLDRPEKHRIVQAKDLARERQRINQAVAIRLCASDAVNTNTQSQYCVPWTNKNFSLPFSHRPKRAKRYTKNSSSCWKKNFPRFFNHLIDSVLCCFSSHASEFRFYALEFAFIISGDLFIAWGFTLKVFH